MRKTAKRKVLMKRTKQKAKTAKLSLPKKKKRRILAGAVAVASVISQCDQKLHLRRLHGANHDAVISRLTRRGRVYDAHRTGHILASGDPRARFIGPVR